MNMLASECGSERESGWTVYLEQSFVNAGVSNRSTGYLGGDGGRFYEKCKDGKAEDVDEREEEELSMVSDASSGPPRYHDDGDDDDDVYLNTDHNGCEDQLHSRQELPSFLDDTASSPFFNFSTARDMIPLENNFETSNVDQASSLSCVLDFSQGFSGTYFEGIAGYQSEFHQNQ